MLPLNLSFFHLYIQLGSLEDMKAMDRGRLDKENGCIVGVRPCDKFLFPLLNVCVLSVWPNPSAVAKPKERLGNNLMPRTSWLAPSAWRSSKACLPWMATCGPTGEWGPPPASNRSARACPVLCRSCAACFALPLSAWDGGCVTFVGARGGVVLPESQPDDTAPTSLAL